MTKKSYIGDFVYSYWDKLTCLILKIQQNIVENRCLIKNMNIDVEEKNIKIGNGLHPVYHSYFYIFLRDQCSYQCSIINMF